MIAANCPNCGAPIQFRFASAVQTVCEFCKSILVRRDVDLEKVGEVADLPRDASPLQIGSEGVYEKRTFVVVGRIVYQYEQGHWNEWHIVMQDGASGWLSDAQLDYAVSFLVPNHPPFPEAKAIELNQQFALDGNNYTVSSRTLASYRGVQGELPFEYWDKQTMLFADLRSHDARFGTIDYSEAPPLFFLGRSVSFDELKLRNLREFEGWR